MLRSEQLEDRIQFILSMLIQRELKDPDLGFITITAARLTKDKGIAKIYYTVLGDDILINKSQKALDRASGFLRSHLAKNLKMRRVPELKFFLDKTLEYGNKIEDLLNKINNNNNNNQ